MLLLHIDRTEQQHFKGFHETQVRNARDAEQVCDDFSVLCLRGSIANRFGEVAQLIRLNYSENEINHNEKHSGGGGGASSGKWKKCSVLKEAPVDVTTQDEYTKFDFQPNWLRTKEYWNAEFEQRYEELKRNATRPNLKVSASISPTEWR